MLWCCPRESGCGKPPAATGGCSLECGTGGGARCKRPYRRDPETCNGYGGCPRSEKGSGAARRLLHHCAWGVPPATKERRTLEIQEDLRQLQFQKGGISMSPGKGAGVSNFEKVSSNALAMRKNVPFAGPRVFFAEYPAPTACRWGKKEARRKPGLGSGLGSEGGN